MSKRLRALAVVLTVSGVLLVSACSHFRHLLGVVADKPQVRLLAVDVHSANVSRMDLEFVLEVYNPNSFSVDVEELQYSVQSLDLDLGHGAHKDVIALKSHEKVKVRLPFQVDPDHLISLMKKYLQNPKELKIKLDATLFLGTALGKMDMHFDEEKTILRGLTPIE